MSLNSIQHSITAVENFLRFLNRPVTNHALSDLVDEKTNNPTGRTFEKALLTFKTIGASGEHHASRIVGMFRQNFAELAVHISVRSGRPTKPIAESILRAIRTDPELEQIHYDAIDLVCYAGERIQALAKTPPQDISFVDGTNTALILVTANRSKTGIQHYSAIPKDLAERLLQRAQEYGFPVIVPNYESLWKTITDLTKRKYGIRLTSRYFRNRFESIGETTPADKMNPNHWMILAGSKPTYGHLPEIYGLRTVEQLAREWETYLLPRLDLSEKFLQPPSDDLAKENTELKEQILSLTKLLTIALANSMSHP